MTVYVMGAGTSLHAKYPLGRDLLRALHEWLETGIDQSKLQPSETRLIRHRYQPYLDQIKESFPGLDDCEEIFRELDSRSQHERNLPYLRDGLAGGVREFFTDIATRESAEAYDRFAQMHAKIGDLIVTFNYDISLERALKTAGKWDIREGYGFPFLPEVNAVSSTRVVKLHGSVNWFQQATQELPPPLIAPRDLKLLGYPNLADPRIGPDGFPTSNTGTLILPDPNKKYDWDKLWEPLWKLAEESVAVASHLVIQGYSFPKSDRRPRELLLGKTNRNALIEICCMSDSDAIASEFHNSGFNNVRPRPDTTFEKWVAELPRT